MKARQLSMCCTRTQKSSNATCFIFLLRNFQALTQDTKVREKPNKQGGQIPVRRNPQNSNVKNHIQADQLEYILSVMSMSLYQIFKLISNFILIIQNVPRLCQTFIRLVHLLISVFDSFNCVDIRISWRHACASIGYRNES